MAFISSPLIQPVTLPPLPIYRFSVDQYHRMIDEGILGEGDAVELLEGLVVLKGNSSWAPPIRVTPGPNGRGAKWPPLPVRRFTVSEYHRMIDSGILNEDDRVELLEGWLVCKMSRKPPHDVVVSLLMEVFWGLLPKNWHCRGQSAVTTDASEPEPDVAIIRGIPRQYLAHHPRPRETALAIEVSDTTLRTDRKLKAAMYGRVGIPIYWIINIPDRQIEVYTHPTGGDPEPGYTQRKDYYPRDTIPLILDGKKVADIRVRDILP
jgi:Uma2 family endonuclease